MTKIVERVTLYPALPLEACHRKLIQSVDENSWNPFSGSSSVVGDIRADGFRLWQRKDWFLSSYATNLRGKFIGSDEGTHIQGEWHIPRWRKNYFHICLGVATLPALGMSWFTINDLVTGSNRVSGMGPKWIALMVPWVAPLVAWLVLKAVQDLEHKDKQRLLSFLKETLLAHDELRS